MGGEAGWDIAGGTAAENDEEGGMAVEDGEEDSMAGGTWVSEEVLVSLNGT